MVGSKQTGSLNLQGIHFSLVNGQAYNLDMDIITLLYDFLHY